VPFQGPGINRGGQACDLEQETLAKSSLALRGGDDVQGHLG
jgi:hypothetical protein